MSVTRRLQILVVALAISGALAVPVRRSRVKSARQIEFTTPATVVEQRTGYPLAGFRPKIAFNLPNEKPERSPESVEIITTTPAASTDFDDVLHATVKLDRIEHIPVDTYGAPFPPSDNAVENEAEVVPAPAEDFQPPSEEASRNFLSDFDFAGNNGHGVIADFPTVEQASETEDLGLGQSPGSIYGPPEVEFNEPKSDVETVEQVIDSETPQFEEDEDNTSNENPQQGAIDIEITEKEGEGSGESEIGLGIHKPAEKYGFPTTKPKEDIETEHEPESTEVEQELEILSHLSRTQTGRLIILPVEKNLYLGRLISSQQKRAQIKNRRLLKL